jgi:hypothetical protein
MYVHNEHPCPLSHDQVSSDDREMQLQHSEQLSHTSITFEQIKISQQSVVQESIKIKASE